MNLHMVDAPVPKPAGNEVRVRVRATSVNDWDWGIVRGRPAFMRLFYGLTQPKIRIPGVDVAGVVDAVGDGVQDLKPGDSVYGDLSDSGFGGFAEYVCAPASAFTAKPDSMSFEHAAAMPHAAMLALQGLETFGVLNPETRLLVNGAGGGVGSLCPAIARHFGIRDVTGVDHSDKLESMRQQGYSAVLDYTQSDFTALGQTWDCILDTRSTRPPSHYLRALTRGGRYCTVGGDTGRLLQLVTWGKLVAWLRKKHVGVLALHPNKGMDRFATIWETGTIRPLIDGPYPLAELPAALHRFGDAKHQGKIVITVDSDTRR